MPRAHEGLEALKGADWFSTVDLASGFHQVPVAESDIEKTAFLARSGLFKFETMPFGLVCDSATFQRLMDIVLAGLKWRSCLVYLVDVLIFTKGSIDDYLRDLTSVFERLRDRIRVQPTKCHLFATELVYLGHVVDR
jgi:hypothetical protein